MFGAISIDLLYALAKRSGWMEQLEFDLPPCIYISQDKLSSVDMGYSWNGTGWISSEDHPAFTSLRNRLEKDGYIKTERSWSNGDRVTKPFYMNNMYFEIGEQFSCAPAQGVSYKIELKNRSTSPELGGVTDRSIRYDTESENTVDNPATICEHTLPLPF